VALQVKTLAVLFDEEFLVIETEAWLRVLFMAFNRYYANCI
jgi:hypothetical protein